MPTKKLLTLDQEYAILFQDLGKANNYFLDIKSGRALD